MAEAAHTEAQGLLKLACELVAGILRQLDCVQHLLQARLACRHINDSFLQIPSLASDVLRKEVPPKIVPYAVAAFKAIRTTSSLNSFEAVLDDLHSEPAKLERHLHDLSFAEVLKIEKRHSIVQDLLESFSTKAWAIMNSEVPVSLSTSEEFRFQRAFYRFDMLCACIHALEHASCASRTTGEAKDQFLSQQSPWANEQIGCVHDFLESQLLTAIRETIAHDIELGEYSVDYLSIGPDNFWLQARLSRGIEHIHELLQNTKERQAVLLRARSDDTASTTIFDILCSETDEGASDDEVLLEEYSQTELEALNPRPDLEDVDQGPYEAWYAAHKEVPRSSLVMLVDDGARRERAYVFWDSRRMHENGLLELFDISGPYSTHDYTEEERETMERSWEARSEIWQKGGRGFWYEGDESKIVWP